MTHDKLKARLRSPGIGAMWGPSPFEEAADAIEKLEADNARLREAMKGPLAWLERWAVHVGNCKGDSACTCGLTFVQHELRAALRETSHD